MKRSDDAEVLIWAAASGAAVAGALNPVPFVGDGIVLITAWITMLTGIAKIYEVSFNAKTFRIGALQAFKSIMLYAVGTLSFIYLLKYTGVGTIAAAIANAALNFGFTAGIGFMYKEAWENDEEPTTKDIGELLKNVIDYFKNGFSKEKRKKMVDTYNIEIGKGKSMSEALTIVLKSFFEDFFD